MTVLRIHSTAIAKLLGLVKERYEIERAIRMLHAGGRLQSALKMTLESDDAIKCSQYHSKADVVDFRKIMLSII